MYYKQKKLNIVNQDKIVNGKTARKILEEKAKCKVTIYKNNRWYNAGEITEYKFTCENGNIFTKKAEGTTLIDTLCELADCELWRISETGKADDKLMGFIVNPVSLTNKLKKIYD